MMIPIVVDGVLYGWIDDRVDLRDLEMIDILKHSKASFEQQQDLLNELKEKAGI